MNIRANSELYNELILYKGRYKKNEKDFLKNIISRNDYSINLDQIRNAILSLIDRISPEDIIKQYSISELSLQIDFLKVEKQRLGEEIQNLSKRNAELDKQLAFLHSANEENRKSIEKLNELFFAENEESKKLKDFSEEWIDFLSMKLGPNQSPEDLEDFFDSDEE